MSSVTAATCPNSFSPISKAWKESNFACDEKKVVAICDHLWHARLMNETAILVPIERIERSILLIRGEKVMLDADLAELYGVTTKRLNEQVKRNIRRFPPDFMFPLTETEKTEVVANCDHLVRLKFSPHRPNAFTEH